MPPVPDQKVARYLADLSPLDEATPRILRHLEDEGKVWVVGAPGTGRSTLARRLERDLSPRLCQVRVPPEGADAAFHALGQLAAMLPGEADRRLALPLIHNWRLTKSTYLPPLTRR